MESEPLAILLDDLTKGHQQNNIYLVSLLNGKNY